jgi:flavin reductase (DIM6/NTAB) family NADH-FMN oxidoreductase RutF
MLPPDQTYQLLRQLTSPVVAVTSERAGKRNGMISDSAVRASIVPAVPRLSVYVHKFNYSHDMIFDTGRFVLHLLHTGAGQFDLIHRLGFFSGREQDKLADIPHRLGVLGVPVLEDCHAYFECRVANVMDTGSSTCFLGDVVEVGVGAGSGAEVLTAAHFRANIPPAWRADYEAQLKTAQAFALARSRDIQPVIWRDLAP